MLDYATCCKLRDAGYPQNEQCAVFWTAMLEDTGLEMWSVTDRAEYISDAERPNSDELIAAIQQRWPGIMLGMVWCGDGELWEANATLPNDTHCPACGKRHTPEPSEEGDTPAAALAALYLALAGGE